MTARTGKHTPGPWTFKPLAGTDESNATAIKHGLKLVQNCSNQGERYVGSEHGPIALVRTKAERKERGKNATPYDAPDAERDANARLIAAAPELLEALESMYALHTGEHGHEEHAAAQSKALTKAELAIAKALGNE